MNPMGDGVESALIGACFLAGTFFAREQEVFFVSKGDFFSLDD